MYLSASDLPSRWQVESFVSISAPLYMAPQTDLRERECVTLMHSAGHQPAASLSMPYKPTRYHIVIVPSPLGGTDEKPNYAYCEYISPAVSHYNKCCTCWDWERTEVVQDN